MSEFRVRPLRTIRHELATLALIASVPVALAFAFPYEAVTFRASEGAPAPEPGCAFVSLTDAEERSALALARTAWQVDATGVRRLRTDLSDGVLPPAPTRPVLVTRPPRARAAPAAAPYAPNALPPTVAAPPPKTIPADAAPAADAPPRPAFPREELLKID